MKEYWNIYQSRVQRKCRKGIDKIMKDKPVKKKADKKQILSKIN